MTTILHKNISSKRERKYPALVCFVFWFLFFLDKDLLHHRNLEPFAKYRYNSNYITACVCVLIIKEENEKDTKNLLQDNN